MRNSGIIVFCMVLVFMSCKTSSVTTKSSDKSSYTEDLSLLRPAMEELNSKSSEEQEVESAEKSLPTNHIKAELDSVNKIIIQNNLNIQYVDGYTIQIYTGSNREEADAAAREARSLLLDIDPKIEYNQPSYKVKVGQYENRLKAHQIFEQLKKDFPLALLIPEKIPVNYD